MNRFIAFTFVLSLAAVVLSGPAQERQIAPEEDDEPNMKYFLVETSDGQYRIEDLVDAEVDTRVTSSDVVFYYHSRTSQGVQVTYNNAQVLQNTDFSATKETIFSIHGWTNSKDSPVNTNITSAVLPKYNVNLFVVDWSGVAAKNYISAKGSVPDIGKIVADFIQVLVNQFNLNLDRLTCVGHSLGAHVCGNAGSSLNGKIGTILGLDPASPLYTVANTGNRLDPSDAEFVEILHTNGGLLGFSAAIGDSDYYPNGGKSQPGCGLDITGSCAHNRAYQYFAESIFADSNKFVAKLCTSNSDYNKGRCDNNLASVMGGLTPSQATGIYQLNTNSAALYAQG